jgi:hypothetical protein
VAISDVNPVRVLGSEPSLKIGLRVHNVLDLHENPNKTKFLCKIVGLPDNETKAIVKLFTGAE